MTVRIDAAGRIDKPVQFFNRFTVKDLGRIGLPAVVGGLTAGVPGAAVAGLAGLGLATYRYNRYPLDKLLYHRLSQAIFTWSDQSLPRVKGVAGEYVTTDTEICIGVVQVHPTNLGLKHDSEKKGVRDSYRRMLYSTDYPLEIHTRYSPLSLEEYVDRVEDDSRFAEDYTRFIDSLGDGSGGGAAQHFVVVRDENPDSVVHRCDAISRDLTSVDINAEPVTGQELARLVYDGSPLNIALSREGFRSSGLHHRLIPVRGLPSQLRLAWPVDVLRNVDGMVNAVQSIDRIDPGEADDTLRRLDSKLRGWKSSLRKAGVSTPKLDSLVDDIDWVQSRLARKEDELFDYACYFVPYAETNAGCREVVTDLVQELERRGIEFGKPLYRGDQAAQTVSFAAEDVFDASMYQPGITVSAGFPFDTQRVSSTDGVLWGVVIRDDTPLFVDRWSWDVGHIVRAGRAGAGKSYAAKLALIRSVVWHGDDLRLHVIDPKPEYRWLLSKLGAERFYIHDGVPEELPNRSVFSRHPDTSVSAEQIAQIIRFIDRESRKNDDKTIIVVDEAHRLLDTGHVDPLITLVREGRQWNNAVTLVTQTLRDFFKNDEGEDILENTPGAVFSYHRNVPERAAEFFDLSEQEQRELLRLRTGERHEKSEAIVKVDRRLNAKIEIESTAAEHSAIIQSKKQGGY